MTTQSSTWHGEPSTPPTASQRAVPGTTIGGRYQLRAAIGHGGMGTVWQAADTVLHRDVAVKEVLLPPGIATADRNALYERTMREARAAAALSHPSVVQVYDVVTEGGRPWIIMELLHARSLADMIISDGPLAQRAVAKIGIALLGALEVAHNAGVLHRDVKPANILICTDGRCVLTDFGVARLPSGSTLTTPGMVLGSPHFISPERAVGGAFGPPSDLFSLGVSLYTAIEGHPPFDRGDPFETMRAVVEEPAPQPVRAGALAPVLYGLLEKDPARRWDVPTSRQALRDLLEGPLANQAVTHVTDPYTVVPVATPPSSAPTMKMMGQVGGRALIPPGAPILPERSELPTPYVAPATPVVLEPTSPGMGPVPANAPSRGLVGDISQGARRAAGGLAGRVRGWPRGLQFGVAGAVVVLLILAVGAASGWFSGGTPAASAGGTPSASPTGPLITNARAYQDTRGFTLNVPSDWNEAKTKSYVDFTDPSDPGRRMRVNVEAAGGTAEQFLLVAESGLKRNTSRCIPPYKRIALRQATLDGRPAAELEYTCGNDGDPQQRHGLWRATVAEKKAYEFYISAEVGRYDETMPIYQEAVQSYKLNLPGANG